MQIDETISNMYMNNRTNSYLIFLNLHIWLKLPLDGSTGENTIIDIYYRWLLSFLDVFRNKLKQPSMVQVLHTEIYKRIDFPSVTRIGTSR